MEEAPGEELELDLMDRVGVVLVQRSRGRHTSRGSSKVILISSKVILISSKVILISFLISGDTYEI